MTKKQSPQTIIIAVLSLVLIIVTALYISKDGVGESDTNPVVAIIDGQKVTLEHANKRLRSIQAQYPNLSFKDLSPESQDFLLREEAAHRVLVKQAKEFDLIKDEELQEKVDTFVQNTLKNAMLTHVANDKVNDQVLQETYAQMKEKIDGQKAIRAQHILTKTEEDAKAAKKALKDKSFEQVAAEFSIDKKSALNGGDLGVLYTGNIVKEFEEAALSLKPGKISNPVKSDYGWHIIKLIDVKDAKLPKYEDAKSQLAKELAQQAIKAYVDGALKDINIERVDVNQEG